MKKQELCCETQRNLIECASSDEVRSNSRFIDLTRDYGFKIVMANQNHPELMIGFLNAVIPERTIVSIRFLNTEVLPPDEEDRRMNYDILCTDSEGNRFLIEMQKRSYDCFADRLMAYAGAQTSHLLKLSEPYTSMRALYVISVMDGYLKVKDEEMPRRDTILRRAKVRMDDSGTAMSDRQSFIFVQLPAAGEPTSDASFIEKWAWYVRGMAKYTEKPSGLDPYFDLLFEASDRKNVEEGKLSIYDRMIRDEIQIAAERDYAVREGRAEGREQGLAEGRAEGRAEGLAEGRAEANLETARNLKLAGIDIEMISRCTGLTVEVVKAL